MIQRFAALMLVAGLGTGLVLRIVAGRGRFGTFVAGANLPLVDVCQLRCPWHVIP